MDSSLPHPVRPEYVDRITPGVATEIEQTWKSVSTSSAYVSGMNALDPFVDEVENVPQNVQEFDARRMALPRPLNEQVRSSISIWAHLDYVHPGVLSPDQRDALLRPWNRLVELVGD